jgi:uncharacterized membrane protein YgaE (UPF0421/DUF939 family)
MLLYSQRVIKHMEQTSISDRLPLRIIKTTISFFIGMVIGPLINLDTFYCAVGSLYSLKESITLSVRAAIEILLANLFAFIIATVFALIFGITPLSATAAMFTLFLFIKKVNLTSALSSSGFVMASLMLLSSDQTNLVDRGILRFFSLVIGMLIALLINILVFRPKRNEDLFNTTHRLTELIHIYMTHDLDDQANHDIDEELVKVNYVKNIINNEKRSPFILDDKKEQLKDALFEIEVLEAQLKVVRNMHNLSPKFREKIIPILIELNQIKHGLGDKRDIKRIKKEIKALYNRYTKDDNFFTNTNFLSDLNIYVNLLRDN